MSGGSKGLSEACIGAARRIFAKEPDAARKRHPVYVLDYQADSLHLASGRKAVDAVL